MQLSNGSCKHIDVKTPLYHAAVPFHCPQIRISLQNLACIHSPVRGFILPGPQLWSSFLLLLFLSPHTSFLTSPALIAGSHLPVLSCALLSKAFSCPLGPFLTSVLAHVCGDVYAFYDLLGSRQSMQPSSSKAIYLSPSLAWPLFVKSRLPLKVYFEGKSRVLFCAHVNMPFPHHQCRVKVLGWEPPAGLSHKYRRLWEFFFFLPVGLVLTRTAAGGWSILNLSKSKMGLSFSLCIHRIRKCQVLGCCESRWFTVHRPGCL